jgi:iron complex outermembrane receptor protein
LAGFISKYRDRQESIAVENEGQFPSLDPSLSLIANAATVDIRGFEWEMQARPVDRLGITFSGGYIKARYGEFFSFDPNQGQNVDISNRRIQNLTPKWQANWSVDYRFDLAGGSTLTPMIAGFYRSGYEFRANTFLGAAPSPIYQEKFVKWDARLTWLSASERLRIALWAKNLFDKDTIGTGSVISAGVRGWTIFQLEAPRTFGIEGTLRF